MSYITINWTDSSIGIKVDGQIIVSNQYITKAHEGISLDTESNG